MDEEGNFNGSHSTSNNNLSLQNSDIVDVVGVTPVPSPAPSSPAPLPTSETMTFSQEDRMETDDGPPTTTTDAEPESQIDDETGRIRCICGTEDDDGFTIQCESCLVWQHASCVGIARSNVPEVYLCDQCRPETDVEVSVAPAAPVPKRKGRPPLNRDKDSHQQPAAASVPSSMHGYNEISENIIAPDVVAELAKLKDNLYESARRRMPRITRDMPLGLVNFELNEVLALSSSQQLSEHSKSVELKDLRTKGSSRRSLTSAPLPRCGVISGEDIDPGALIGEYVGHVQLTSMLDRKVPMTENVGTSHVLFCRSNPEVIVDARKFGNIFRFVRRSCRPNCEAKLVLLPTEDASLSAHWCLFARNTIKEHEELFLPFDYSDGNYYFRYECNCAYPELCLAEDMVIPGVGTVPEVPSAPMPVSTAPSQAQSSSSSRRGSAPEKKLSREERKLQHYIEFIERMESGDHKKPRKTGSHGSSKGSHHGSGTASPPPPAYTGNLQLSASIDDMASSQGTSPAKRGRKPKKPPASPENTVKESSSDLKGESINVNIVETINIKPDPYASTATKESSSTPASPGSPGKLPLKKYLSKAFSSRSPSSPASESIPSSPTPASIKAEPAYGHSADDKDMAVDDSSDKSQIIDVVGEQSNPETPSKKRVSLTDYLSRRKSSPAPQMTQTASAEVETEGDVDVEGSSDNLGHVSTSAPPSTVLHSLSSLPSLSMPIVTGEKKPSPFFAMPSPILPTRYVTPPPPVNERQVLSGSTATSPIVEPIPGMSSSSSSSSFFNVDSGERSPSAKAFEQLPIPSVLDETTIARSPREVEEGEWLSTSQPSSTVSAPLPSQYEQYQASLAQQQHHQPHHHQNRPPYRRRNSREHIHSYQGPNGHHQGGHQQRRNNPPPHHRHRHPPGPGPHRQHGHNYQPYGNRPSGAGDFRSRDRPHHGHGSSGPYSGSGSSRSTSPSSSTPSSNHPPSRTH